MKPFTCEHIRSLIATTFMTLFLIAPTATYGEVPVGPPTFSNPTEINNTYFPFQIGGVKVFRGWEHGATVMAVDQYLPDTRVFQWNGTSVTCRVLREIAFEDGALVEVSDNYFAQADDGTVYYFGEVVDNYEDGVVADHEGSWLVGGPTLETDPPETGNAPNPAVFMPGNPELGDVFKPEDLFPIVDETAEVISVGRTIRVPAGVYKDSIRLKETTMLGPGTERKWYAPGVGVIKVRARGEWLRLIASTLAPVNNNGD